MNVRPRLATAPLLDVSDRHARYFWRLLSRQALLYTEMINMGAICRGAAESHLRFNPEERPVALQLGGSDPAMLAHSARMGEQWGYDEINLNCGCPSDRVQRGAFGACLMREPQLVADCIKAMQDAVQRVPISVKHRIGLDKDESYAPVRDFVGTLAEAGCRHFIVHARNAWLQGLSPHENRCIPPLRYEVTYQLKRDFPALHITLNGGVGSPQDIVQHWQQVDAVMIGRAAWHTPWLLAQWDALMDADRQGRAADWLAAGAEQATAATREAVEEQMVQYMEREAAQHGTGWPTIARCMLGLRHGQRGARRWRQVWSDHKLKHLPAREVWRQACAAADEAHATPHEAEET
ncbi:MAG: tRNA dihydrouridine(20/20a) synthase DusA [Brachymonas sp.]|nr:tRNA dihydrouridine(20/20a) synthase DusA [Brachymonas sp.]